MARRRAPSAAETREKLVARATPRSANASTIRDTSARRARRAMRISDVCAGGTEPQKLQELLIRPVGWGMTLSFPRRVRVSVSSCKSPMGDGRRRSVTTPRARTSQAVRTETVPARRARALRRRAGRCTGTGDVRASDARRGVCQWLAMGIRATPEGWNADGLGLDGIGCGITRTGGGGWQSSQIA